MSAGERRRGGLGRRPGSEACSALKEEAYSAFEFVADADGSR